MTGSPVLRENTSDRWRGATPSDVTEASWRKSTYSNLNGNCVEVGRLRSDRVGVRDTKDDGAGPVLIFTAAEWDGFLAAAQAGRFDIS